MKFTINAVAACVLAFALAGCGDNEVQQAVCGNLQCESSESAEACAEDCGCGNGIANPGEDCDGTDVGDATCASVVERGGTLACNADCTFDVDRCDDYTCGNGIVEPGEECDGADLAGATCASAGFSAGQVGCTTSCRLDTVACCNSFCDAANTSMCVGDTAQTCTMMANGCLALEVTDCAADDNICDDSTGTATCTCADACSTEGSGRCVATVAQSCAMQANGCLDWATSFDCAMTGQDCAIGPQGATCTASASGEDCFDAFAITPGQNLIGWTATNADYLTDDPSCFTASLTGPDVVLSYTATVNGIAAYSIAKQADMRHVVVVTRAACGTITDQSEVSCVADTDPTVIGDSFPVTAGTTYYFYLRDSTTGSAALPSPLLLDLTEASCSGLTTAATNFSPAAGSTVSTSSPILSFDLPNPVDTSTGVITLTGDQGTMVSYDLATTQTAVTFSNGGRTVHIDPPNFLPNETVTVSWSGLVDEICGLPIAPPTWTFVLGTPSCSPGVGGMVGTTIVRRATGVSSFTEQYVVADPDPNGYVYFGGQSDLYRMPKGIGPVENVASSAVIGSTQLGYAVGIVGTRIFSLDTTTSTTASFLWQLSTSGGVSWNPLGYSRWPVIPGASTRAMFQHGGRLYMVTDETTATAATEIWSVSANATQLPQPAVREGTLTGVNDCDGIAGDDFYFYLSCDDDNNHIIRVNRTTFQHELITDAVPLSTSKNELHADDFDGDGRADALYVKSDDESVRYVCGPGAAAPFWYDVLVDFGPITTSNHGLGFDPVANALWAYDDDNQNLVLIQ